MFIKKHSIIGVLVLLILAFGTLFAGCGSDEPAEVALKHSFTQGDSWTYEISVSLNGSVNMPGLIEEALPQDATIKMLQSVTVDDVTDGVATVISKSEVLEVGAAGETIDIGPEGTQEFTMRIDEQGRILSVVDASGADLLENLQSAMPFDMSQLSNHVGVVFPKDGFAQVGKEWSETTTFPIPGYGDEITATVKAKVVAVETTGGREIATIDYTLDIPMDLSIDLAEALKELAPMLGDDAAGLSFNIAMKGSIGFVGTAKIDTADGQAMAMDGDMDLRIDMQITDAPASVPADQRGPISMDMKAKIGLERK